MFTKERKVFFIQNHSFEHRISFTWHVTNPDHIRVSGKRLVEKIFEKNEESFLFKYIRIHPSRGIINTNESKMCKLTFISMGDPQFYNIDLICEVKNETEMDVYRKKIDLWKKEQVRQYEEFVIEENELAERLVRLRKNTILTHFTHFVDQILTLFKEKNRQHHERVQREQNKTDQQSNQPAWNTKI